MTSHEMTRNQMSHGTDQIDRLRKQEVLLCRLINLSQLTGHWSYETVLGIFCTQMS